MTVKTSIIIPTWNHLDDCLRPCLESLLQYTSPDAEVIVVANGCTHDTRAYVESLGDRVRLIWCDEPLGYAGACNAGIEAATGDVVVLLNNDTVLLEQELDAWLAQLSAPFADPTVGLTGPLMQYSPPGGCEFLVFFCVMIRRSLFAEVGLLDTAFAPGGGEDTAFCIEARRHGYRLVCVGDMKGEADGRMIGSFPIFHAAEQTVKDLPEWSEIFARNSLSLADRYNPSWAHAERVKRDQWRYGNEWERTVIGHEPIDEQIYARELARYRWASQRIRPGMKVLEFGCSSGFATRLLPAGIEYTGVDYSRDIINYATDHFGDKGSFVWSTIDRFLDEHAGERWDVVIAFEVLEHVRNGREVAQRLKQFAPHLLLSTPYREPVGFWGKHHVLHGLNEKDFSQFAYSFMHIDGSIHSFPTSEIANLLLMEWQEGQTYTDRHRVLCAIPTRGRYDALMQCLQSVAFQTLAPDKVIIYDDGEHADLREHPIGRYVLPLLTKRGIDWEVVWTPGRGQHIAHQLANNAGYDLVWRIDDDCVAEPDVLQRLLALMAPDVGAVGGAVYEIQRPVLGGTNKIEDFFSGANVQWAPDHGTFDVDHLYCSFLYRAGLVDYKHTMSPAAFHEETIFSYRLKRAGWRLIADTSIHTHHFKSPHGGTRAADLEWAYAWDQAEFLRVMEHEFGIKLIHLGVGLGDNFAFLHILPELKRKYSRVVLGSVYPEVFADEGVTLIPYDKAKENSKENVYDFMSEHNWKGHLIDAFREMYLQ